MSEHLTEQDLHDYLDGELTQERRRTLDTHLAECVDCQGRLAAAEGLFATIAGLPDQPLLIDLTPRVLQAIAPANRWLPSLALGQALAALAVTVGLLLGLGSATVSLRLTESAQQLTQSMEAVLQAALASAAAAFPDLSGVQFELGLPAIWSIAIGALAVWGLSNGLMLRRVIRRS